MGIRKGVRWVTYASGPIPRPDSRGEKIPVEELCVYRSSVTRMDNSKASFSGYPGALFANVGKGKVMVTSFHPEYRIVNLDISMGMIYAVSGVKARPVFPKKNYRPLRVAMFVSAIGGKEPLRRMFELDKHPDIDLHFISTVAVGEGVLEHADVFFVPDGVDEWFADFYRRNKRHLLGFAKRGGRIITSGKGEASILKNHKNLTVVTENQSVAEAALKR